MTSSYLNSTKSFVHIYTIKITEDGLRLLEEENSQVLFDKETEKLAKKVPKIMLKLKATNSVPSVRSLLSTAGDMFEKYYDLQNSIVFQALLAMVFEKLWDKKIRC